MPGALQPPFRHAPWTREVGKWTLGERRSRRIGCREAQQAEGAPLRGGGDTSPTVLPTTSRSVPVEEFFGTSLFLVLRFINTAMYSCVPPGAQAQRGVPMSGGGSRALSPCGG